MDSRLRVADSWVRIGEESVFICVRNDSRSPSGAKGRPERMGIQSVVTKRLDLYYVVIVLLGY